MSTQTSVQQKLSNFNFDLQQLIDACSKIEANVYGTILDQKIQGSYIQNEQQEGQLSENKLFLLFGNTTSGKTTLMYYICEDLLQYGYQQNKKLSYLIPNKQFQNCQVNITPITITTRVPNIRYRNSGQIGQKVVFVEIPDVKQLKTQQKIVEYSLLNNIFSNFNKIHFLLVIAEEDLDDVQSIIQSVQTLTSLFDIKKQQIKQGISRNSSLIISKATDDLDQLKEKLVQMNGDLIKQENQEIFDIIHRIVDQGRLYVIKSEQPAEQDQKKLFQKVIQNSSLGQFKNQPILYEQMSQLDQNFYKQIVQRQQLKKLWTEKAKQIKAIFKYLVDEKAREQKFGQVSKIVQQTHKKLRHETQSQQEYELKGYQGSLNKEISLGIQQFLNLMIQVPYQKLADLSLSLFSFQFQQIKLSTLSQLRANLYSKQSKQSKQQEKFKPSNQLPSLNRPYLVVLVTLCNAFIYLISFITKVLNYSPQEQRVPQIINKDGLLVLEGQLIRLLREQLSDFDLGVFKQDSKKKNKKKTDPFRHVKTRTVATLLDLKRQFQKSFANDRSKSYLFQVFNLPNTHFKLLLLVQQFAKDIQLKNQKQFMTSLSIVREICKILDMSELYIEEIKFLLVIPDWNKIDDVLRKIEDAMKKGNYLLDHQKDKQSRIKIIQFLARLSKTAKEKRRRRLSQKAYNIARLMTQEQEQANPVSSLNRQSQVQTILLAQLQQNWPLTQINQLCLKSSQNQCPSIIEKVQSQYKILQNKMDTTNQFQFLMGHDPIYYQK